MQYKPLINTKNLGQQKYTLKNYFKENILNIFVVIVIGLSLLLAGLV